jgi:microcystin-dependent protein
MARVAEYRDDITGALVTAGTSTAYTVTSNQGFDTLAHMDGMIIAFSPHVTNGGFCSLAVDGLTPRNIRSSPGVDIPSGTLIQGTPYVAVYNNAAGVFYLHNFFGNPYSIPIAGSIDYWASTAPNSSFAIPYGQPISRTTYATLFALIGTTYGAGDGSTTFNLPDLRGRSVASPDNMGGGVDPNRLTAGLLAGVRNSIGGAGGESGHALVVGEIPNIISSSAGVSVSGTFSGSINSGSPVAGGGTGVAGGPGNQFTAGTVSGTISGATATINVASLNTGGGSPNHNNMQPTILAYRILRVLTILVAIKVSFGIFIGFVA